VALQSRVTDIETEYECYKEKTDGELIEMREKIRACDENHSDID